MKTRTAPVGGWRPWIQKVAAHAGFTVEDRPEHVGNDWWYTVTRLTGERQAMLDVEVMAYAEGILDARRVEGT